MASSSKQTAPVYSYSERMRATAVRAKSLLTLQSTYPSVNAVETDAKTQLDEQEFEYGEALDWLGQDEHNKQDNSGKHGNIGKHGNRSKHCNGGEQDNGSEQDNSGEQDKKTDVKHQLKATIRPALQDVTTSSSTSSSKPKIPETVALEPPITMISLPAPDEKVAVTSPLITPSEHVNVTMSSSTSSFKPEIEDVGAH
ncbi:hypothetical protein BDV95DRAFT_611939 [Massariosphaeria phaeospora]|uniref:Uncharacterized protein n=1 Tax=Massariosphaeria phaeospora TaxID=100035 RepID=A0A7C8M2V9_9PLEO|nr:hypothetical protein BDV95DRAFT_611939 [Massariosphaeria phaeospora]